MFNEIRPNLLPLMKDVFGNYVVQKFFQFGDQIQKKYMVTRMKGQIPDLSTSVYGCRVVQTVSKFGTFHTKCPLTQDFQALDHILVDQQAAMIGELKDHVNKCLKDENGNHVLQKAIMAIPEEHIKFLLDEMLDQIPSLSRHKYGCRVVQKILKHSEPPTKAKVLEEIHRFAALLIADEYGNYVPQHVIEHGSPEDRGRLIAAVMDHLISFSRQKFASNVVEKCISFGTDDVRHRMLLQLFSTNEKGEDHLTLVLKDNYGNYVIRE